MKIPTEASRRVAQSLLHEGPATAPELAERLGMTPAGVRRHLDTLAAEDVVVAGQRPAFGPAPTRGRGRPPQVFSITDAGREIFEHSYDDLAVSALRFLRDTAGDDAVAQFAVSRAAEMERRYLPLVDGDVAERAHTMADALNGDGFAASVTEATSVIQICQHNCPVAHVAAEFPQLCDAEASAFARVLGTNVTRLATIAHGDGVCTTVVARAADGDHQQPTQSSPERITS